MALAIKPTLKLEANVEAGSQRDFFCGFLNRETITSPYTLIPYVCGQISMEVSPD